MEIFENRLLELVLWYPKNRPSSSNRHKKIKSSAKMAFEKWLVWKTKFSVELETRLG